MKTFKILRYFIFLIIILAMIFLACKDIEELVAEEEEDPVLSVEPTSISFGEDATSRTFNITNEGGGTLEWSVNAGRSWLNCSPSSGTGAASVTVTLDRSAVNISRYVAGYPNWTGTITVAGAGESINIAVSGRVKEEAPPEPEKLAEVDFTTFSNTDVQTYFSLRDDNSDSGIDYWGMVTYVGQSVLWCAGYPTSNISTGNYDNDMDAVLTRKEYWAWDISGHEDVYFKVRMKYSIEYLGDNLDIAVYDETGQHQLYGSEGWSFTDINMDWTWYEFRLSDIESNNPNNYQIPSSKLRTIFTFYSDDQVSDYLGVLISHIEIWGTPK